MKNFIPLSMQRSQRDIQRCGLAAKIQDYDLTQHSYGVLSICCDLVRILELDPLTQIEVEAILRHDIAETFTGDLPWTIKNMSAEVEDKWGYIEQAILEEKSKECPILEQYSDKKIEDILTGDNYWLFKIADMLDLLLYCCKEEQLGNHTPSLKIILKNALHIFCARVKAYCTTYQYSDKILEIFKEYVKTSGYPRLEKCPELENMED